ncbi:carbohydrate esterase family 3 protein [Chaetomium sp. MPI-SDFR-AT-0129]|uniref:Carbohydrate esterase n=1 Tax=Dichotomopilus funicola TaxID=1934379 RepID=A0AAN6V7P2_9PEZI|nr:carbohydrate esterase family 3 protein [Chaetomium sp. MPI-SDFR-AT-0129]KAK4145969.1 carbohydrate esterase [Dichotomopilus funicola]
MVALSLNALVAALTSPLALHGIASTSSTASPTALGLRSTTPLGHGVPLRIMPLGASITYGTASTDGNGYRASLRSQIVSGPGNPVNMVGSEQVGTMVDNDVEGWPGYRIEQVHEQALLAASTPQWHPNVFLINAGTNDAAQHYHVSAAGDRMEAMLDDLWRISPRAVVVLSTLLVNRNASTEANVGIINTQLQALATKLRFRQGRRIVLVDMHSEAGPGTADLVDGTHPNDGGYVKMANIWFQGLVVASDLGWLLPPQWLDGVPDDGAATTTDTPDDAADDNSPVTD